MNLLAIYSSCIVTIHLILFLTTSQPVNAFTPVPSFLPYMSGTLEKWDISSTGMRIFDHNARKFYNQRIQKSGASRSKMAWIWPKVLVPKISTAPGQSPSTTPTPNARPQFQKHRQINTLVTATLSRHLSRCYTDSTRNNSDNGQKKQFSALFDRYALRRHNLEQRNFARSIVCE